MTYSTSNITELIRKQLSATGEPADLDKIRDAEIKMHIQSVANALLKAEVFNTTYNFEGESIPDGCVIATYTLEVTKGAQGTAKARLPITPLYLPDKMGVFAVYPTGYDYSPEQQFVYAAPGTYNVIQRERLISPLGKKCYTWDSGVITVFADLIDAGITTIDVKLCVMDLGRCDDNDPLPITPDMASVITSQVVAIYQGGKTIAQ